MLSPQLFSHLFQGTLLSLLIWIPIFGGLIVLALGRDESRHGLISGISIFISLLTLALCIPLLINFDASTWQMQFTESHAWVPSLNLMYSLGVDGVSVLFIVLTCFTNLIIVLVATRSVKQKLSQFMAIFLISAGIMNGSFAATDSILFYFFWEASMIPMYLGIGIWGGKDRAFAALKFFLFTFTGSVFMLLAFLYLHSKTGSFSIQSFQDLNLTKSQENWIFLAFFLAFAVKIPMWPLHTWLPNAHAEAPAGGSIILAALMLKMGAYGFLRFSLPITPGVSQSLDWLLIILGLVAIVYAGFASIAQKDTKQLIAYSSISHMGIVTLGLFMVFMIIGETHDRVEAMVSVQGAVFQMISHAFSSGALFIGAGYLADRFHVRLIKDYQGLATSMPIFAAFFMLFAMANVGLPGTAGFVGEFLVILSAFKANIWIALIASSILILSPAYTLWATKKILFGEPRSQIMARPNDISGMELLVFILLAIPVIGFGLYPEAILNISHATTAHFINQIMDKIPQGAY